ncbi:MULTISPECIES: hypothetical protein [Pseudomonas syringae group]|uniref:hypothetical protein n=1 Tax=Pseudomonas syringae group TaxID=136849 RepID=UPI0001E29CA7|nr:MULTISPECIES: hypothetical protein [Pseudomonas syringae group]MDG6423750.1 hypothetical protein [Pseudomonas syringae pv. actinidiae]MDU8454843.1 hypothetical protein [Pseudomonas syringae group sp. J254-4]
MPEIVFGDLDEGAQEEIRQLANDFEWTLEYAVRRYIEAGESLAIQRQLELMRRPPARLALVDHKKALDRD